MTPEGLVKSAIKARLHSLNIYPLAKADQVPPDAQGVYFMPIGGPYSIKGIPDFLICFKGRFMAIEAKAPKKTPTKLQLLIHKAIRLAGGIVGVVDDEKSLDSFCKELDSI